MLDMINGEARDLIGSDVSHTDGGPQAKMSAPKVADVLHNERQTSRCIAIDELRAGHTSTAAPIRDATNRVIASVNVAGPTFRLADQIEVLAATTKVAARRLGSIMAAGPGRSRLR